MVEERAMDPTTLWLFGIVFSAFQAAFLFLWNNIRADIKEMRKQMDNKADKIDVERRRNDVQNIYEKMEELRVVIAAVEKDVAVLVATKGTSTGTRRR